MKRKIFTDSFSGALVPIVKIAITFVMAPLIVSSLGDYDYGIWEITFAIVGYMGVLDLGLLPAIVRGVSWHHAQGDKEELQHIFSTALAYFVPIGLILGSVLFVIIFFAPGIFGGTIASDYQKYLFFFAIISVQIFFNFVGGVFDGYMEGMQLYTLRNGLTIVFSLLGAIILYPVLKSGGGLIALAMINALGFSIKLILYGILLTRPGYGSLRFRFEYVSINTLQRLFSFGAKSFIYAVSLRITHMTDSLVIGAFIGPVAVTYYAIPVNLLNHARNLLSSATRNFMPLFSELDASASNEQLKIAFLDGSRLLMGIIMPIMAGIFILGPSFIAFWMGKPYAEQGRWVLYIMAVSIVFHWLNPIGNRFLTGLDRHGVQARFGVYNAVLNLSLSLLLVHFLGKEGVALGTLLPVMVLEPLLLRKTCNVAGFGLWHYVRAVLLPLVLPLGFFIGIVWGAMLIWPPTSVYAVLSIGFLGMAAYLPVFLMLVLRPVERELFLKWLWRKAPLSA